MFFLSFYVNSHCRLSFACTGINIANHRDAVVGLGVGLVIRKSIFVKIQIAFRQFFQFEIQTLQFRAIQKQSTHQPVSTIRDAD
jgi:hypothetical protein